MQKYRHNHYVPISYQRRFMLPGQGKYYRLDLTPDTIVTPHAKYTRRAQHHWGPDSIFAEEDLYTTVWGAGGNTDIEQFFFGRLDDDASAALDYFTNFNHEDEHYSEELFHTFMRYMSVQKLRTPKGIAAFGASAQTGDKNATLILLQEMRDMYCATWTECVWQIADASESATKLIISDHPVTSYNRACPHLSKYCTGANDPDIRLHATHTYFPLSLNKVLILTNLSWVRDPYQNEVRFRPNPGLFRETIFNFLDLQVGRKLNEAEVLQINLITKRRAYRYIAAANEERLYPERTVSTDHWKKFGGGYLLMPEPRNIHLGGEVTVGYRGGGGQSFSPYGHKRGQPGFKDEKREQREAKALYQFQAEWAMMHGAKYTSYNNFAGGLREDSESMMAHHKEVHERARRRR